MSLSITVNQHINVNQSYAIHCVALVFYNSKGDCVYEEKINYKTKEIHR